MAQARRLKLPKEAGVDVSKLLDKAQVAGERGNYDYAIDLYLQLLEFEPDHVEARKLLRGAEVRRCQERGITSSTVSGWVTGFGSLLSALVFQTLRKYEKAMSSCEAFLKNDPYNHTVLGLLAQAAEKCDMVDTAVLVLEDMRTRGGAPTTRAAVRAHVKVLRRVANLYVQTDQYPLAAQRLEEILRLLPKDRDAEGLVRDVAARRSMSEGKWDQAGQEGGYRQVLKSEQDSRKQEASHRDIRTRDDVLQAIERVQGDIEKDPENTRYLLQLGDYYKMLHEWDTARATYEKARQIDPSNFLIQQHLGDLKLAEMDEEIAGLASDETKKEALAKARAARQAFAVQDYERRVQARPQDLPTRYAYGEVLLALKRYKDASVQFQHASRDPKTRRGALYRLGICFMKQGLVDLAMEQFSKAVSDASLVDGEVKSILYALAQVLESQNRLSEALDAYKRIFEVDINFQNVSTKIEELYKRGAQDGAKDVV